MEIHVEGTPVHTRTLSVRVSAAAEGRLEVRGVLFDLRKRGLVPMAGDLQTAGIIHHMCVDAVVEIEGPTLVGIRADQPHVAFEPSEATGGESCRDPVRRIEALEGEALDGAYAKRLGTAIGGPLGCSHVLTLAQLVCATAVAALEAERRLEARRRPDERVFQRSLSVDGLHAGDGALQLSLQLADVHFAPAEGSGAAMDRLAMQHEVRVWSLVDLDALALREVRAAERRRDPSTLGDAAWHERSADLEFLSGQGALGGTARALFEGLGEDRPLLDALLNLAPALIQCLPILNDRWRPTPQGPRPSMPPGGGMVDSCYMWRREGVMNQRMGPALESYRRAAARK